VSVAPNPLTVAIAASERLTRALVSHQQARALESSLTTLRNTRDTAWRAFLQVNASMAAIRPEPVDPLETPEVSDLTDELRAIVAKSQGTVR